ncbi:hypothetical protein [Brevundimonas sp.]|uniref:hypothetical protein n=1 Tax=Brevundimonas sp. TaxID=1871086 RepID=UPI003D6CC653
MSLDLMSWPELRDAEADLASAHAQQAEATRRVRCAPHGEISARQKALQEAVQRSLQAELHLHQVRAAIRRSSAE